MNVVRTFISIDLPENIRKEVARIQQTLPEFKGKLTETENLHLTLKFLGNIGEKTLSEVKNRLKEINFETFKTKISEIGVFSPDNIKIIWIKLDSCEELQKSIDEELSGIFEKEKRFMSHLTIARAKKIKGKEKFLNDLKKMKIPSGLGFEVESFNLKKSTLTSNGPVYETLGTYYLKKQ
ncbi:MAG: RNA 2',3'-cyclic phosphodiesterase [Nanoarchaeota archaeon]